MPTPDSASVRNFVPSPIPRSDRIRLPRLGFRARFRARFPACFGIILCGRVRVSFGRVYAYARLRIRLQFRNEPDSALEPNPTSATRNSEPDSERAPQHASESFFAVESAWAPTLMPSPVPDSVTDSALSSLLRLVRFRDHSGFGRQSRQISVPTLTQRTFALFSTRRGGPSSTPQRFLGGLQDPYMSLIYYFQAWFRILSLSLSSVARPTQQDNF
jgi:hypothetical protein